MIKIKRIIYIWLLLYIEFSFTSRPNVLFVIFDDLKPALVCYKDHQAYTPNIDKLASKSFIFTRTYAQQALCAPSRNSFLTSRRPDSLHLYDFYSYWRETVGNFTTLPQHFKNHGYFTHAIGKVFHPGISSNFTDDQPYSWSQQPFHPPSEIFKNSKVCIDRNGELAMNLICPVDVEFQPLKTLPDIESTEEALKFLKNYKKKKPFFLAVGFQKPHIPFKFPEEFLKLHPLSNISLPNNRFRPSTLPTVAWSSWIDLRTRDDIKKLNISFPFGAMSENTMKEIIQAYHASVSYVDNLFGKILKKVDLKNTVIVVTGDHGWSLGQKGEFSKYSNFEDATRVPLIIHVPNLSKKEIIVDSLVELVDLFPSLVDLTFVSESLKKCPKKRKIDLCTEGESFVPVMIEALKNHQVKGKSAVFTQYPRSGSFPSLQPNSDRPRLEEIRIMGYSISTKRYRFCEWIGFNFTSFSRNWSHIFGREFYDHLIDPNEDMNLIDRPELNGIIETLKKKLIKGWR